MVVQIAAARGARVIGTASERNHAYLRELGVEPTSYGDGLAERVRALAPGGVDTPRSTASAPTRPSTSPSSSSPIATASPRSRRLHAEPPPASSYSEAGRSRPGTEVREAARLQLTALVEQGKLKVRTRSFALDEVAAAHREGEAGHVTGKLILVPSF